MKKLAPILLSLTTASHAAVLVYSEDFSSETLDPMNSDVISLGPLPATPAPGPNSPTTVVADQFFSSRNFVGISGGTLNLGGAGRNRSRGAGIWLDASAFQAGTATITFDVTNFTLGTGSPVSTFEVHSANGVDTTNTVGVDIQAGTTASNSFPIFSTTGTAAVSQIGSDLFIAGNQNQQTFTFTYNGTDQFIGLFFTNISSSTTGHTQNSFSIDNIEFEIIPEPSSSLLLGISGVILLTRRRREKKQPIGH